MLNFENYQDKRVPYNPPRGMLSHRNINPTSPFWGIIGGSLAELFINARFNVGGCVKIWMFVQTPYMPPLHEQFRYKKFRQRVINN